MSDPDVHPEDALEVAQRALAEVQDLKERVAEFEAGEGSTDEAVEYDDRDSAVIEHLEPGEPVKIVELRRLYRRHTDIRSDTTLKKRIQGLVAGPDFDIAGVGEICYDPDGDRA
ncbi:hypothetical protein [Natrinema salifodinae]|uniref:Uncharacterized protein n=1 Tax=Natrinema salifodinae TaxID=1202768 RepID=A0A1I0P8C4_9EURY|nr:hypothetical protein [Natrinema salifodinae]SEW10594.1 hypothetical protein SAMN05216285_2270 [Natrinema salifodinae]